MLVTVQEVLALCNAVNFTPTFPSLSHLLNEDAKSMEQALKMRQNAQETLSEMDKETRPKFDNALWAYQGPLPEETVKSVLTHVSHTHGPEHTLSFVGSSPCTCPRCWQGTASEVLCARCEEVTTPLLV